MLAKVARSFRQFRETGDDLQLSTDLTADIPAHPTEFPIASYPMTMAAFITIHGNYSTLITNAKGGDSSAVALRNDYRKTDWLPAVEKWGDFVDKQCGGNPGIVLMSGFHATKTTRDAATLPNVMVLDANSPAPGTLDFESKTPVNASEFTVIGIIDGHAVISEDGDVITIETKVPTTITILNSHKKKGRIGGLASRVDMLWTILAKNAKGSGLMSKLIKVFIQ